MPKSSCLVNDCGHREQITCGDRGDDEWDLSSGHSHGVVTQLVRADEQRHDGLVETSIGSDGQNADPGGPRVRAQPGRVGLRRLIRVGPAAYSARGEWRRGPERARWRGETRRRTIRRRRCQGSANLRPGPNAEEGPQRVPHRPNASFSWLRWIPEQAPRRSRSARMPKD